MSDFLVSGDGSPRWARTAALLAVPLLLLSWTRPLRAQEQRPAAESDGPPGADVAVAITRALRLGSLKEARAGHTATLKPDGTVLLAGGQRKEQDILSSAEVFDPNTLQSVLLPTLLADPRMEHSATLVPTGEVLLAAGRDADGVLFGTELADLDGSFSRLASSVQIPRAGHSATLLPDGRVVVLGGLDASRLALDQGEIFDLPTGVLYDPRSGSFTPLPRALTVPRHDHTATLLPDGRVLVVGGQQEGDVLGSAELFDPALGESRLLDARLRTARLGHTASLLNDGRVLIAGGRAKKKSLGTVEVYEPGQRTFTKLKSRLRKQRFNHTATVLPTGAILLAGGLENAKKASSKSTELFVQPGGDTTPPTILGVQPAGDATGVSRSPLIAIQFSEPINVRTLTGGTLTLTASGAPGSAPSPVAGAVSPGEEGLLAFFVPTSSLAPGTTHTLTLQGLTDRAGNPLATFTSRFITGEGPPELSGFSPESGPVGTTVVLAGSRFDPVPANNQVKFNGVPAVVTAATTTSITTAVPPGATTGPISVTTAGGTAVSAVNFTVLTGPTIFGIDPTSGDVGTPVTITGSGFDPAPGGTLVTFFGDAAAAVTGATAAELRVTVPATAETGPISVRTALGTAQGPEFRVLREQDFGLTVSPGMLVLLQGSATSAHVQLSSTGTRDFTGLAALTVEGLPAGVSAQFEPATLSALQTGTLRLTASSAATPGPFALNVRGQRGPLVRTAPVALTVQANAGTTGVKGRFVTPGGQGIAGVIARAETGTNPQPQTASDAAGNFLLTGLPSGQVTLRMDATPTNPGFPIWGHSLELGAGQITMLADWVITPPPPAERFTTINNAAQDQIITDTRYPGLEILLPAGVTIVGWDGVPKTRLAVERLEPDRLPISPPPIPTKSVYQIFWGTPMGGIPSQPIRVTLPNDLDLEPGERTELWYYDAPPTFGEGVWRMGGTGTASADGKVIRTDPGSGIPRFCGVCGMPCFKANQNNVQKPPCPSCPPNQNSPYSVKFATGQELLQATDLAISGLVPLGVSRAFHPRDPFNNIANTTLSLGLGWTNDYDVALLPFSPEQTRIILSGHNRVDFTPDGTGGFEAKGAPRFYGARLSPLAGNQWELKYRDGRLWRFAQFGLIHLLTEQRDPNGNSLVIVRGSNGKIQTVQGGQRSLSFNYGANGFISEIRDQFGRAVQYTYTAQSRVETVTAPDGGVTRYTYVDDSEFPNFPACSSAPGGVRLKTIQMPGQTEVQTLYYGPGRRVLRETLPNGEEMRFSYKVTGACVTHVSNPATACTGPSCPTEDSWQNFEAGWRIVGGTITATTMVDGRGRKTTQRFNTSGMGTEETNAEGQAMRYVRDSQNRITAMTDPLGRTWLYEYDAKGNRTKETDPLGRVTDIVYDVKWNKPTSITRYLEDGTAAAYEFVYDVNTGSLLRALDPLNHGTTYTYTPQGQLKAIRTALNQTTTADYNTNGDLIQITDPLGNEEHFTADGVGRTTKTTDALGFDTELSYSPIDQLEQITDSNLGVTQFKFDLKRDLTSIINPLNNTIEAYEYDALHRLTRRTDATTESELLTYDPAGNRKDLTDRKGQLTRYTYDDQNRITQVEYADSSVQTRSYDLVGRLVEVREAGSTIMFGYDAVDRVIKVTTDAAAIRAEVAYEYDALDRVKSRTVSSPGLAAEVTRYTYDLASRLTQIDHRDKSTIYEWDDANRLTRKALPNGIKKDFQYDLADQLTQLQYKRSDDTVLQTIAYAYDANGNRTSKAIGAASVRETNLSEAYDEANRLRNLTLTTAGKSFTLAYDDNGNLASKVEDGNPVNTTSYGWDVRNRLIGITGPGLSASFQYDALGRRITKTVNGNTIQYVYDGLQAIGEIANGQVTTTLLTGLQIDEVIARYAQTGNRVYLTDALGSVIAQVRDDLSIQNSYAYTPYGETTALGPDEGNPIQYTARENDETGLYYYRARYYDPQASRFISEDRIGLEGGANLYGYVEGNPVRYRDPEGLQQVRPTIPQTWPTPYIPPRSEFVPGSNTLGQNLTRTQNQSVNPQFEPYDPLKQKLNPQLRYGCIGGWVCPVGPGSAGGVCTPSNPQGLPQSRYVPGPFLSAPGQGPSVQAGCRCVPGRTPSGYGFIL